MTRAQHTVYTIPKSLDWHVAQRMPDALRKKLAPAVGHLRTAFSDVGLDFDILVEVSYPADKPAAKVEFHGDELSDSELHDLASRLSGLKRSPPGFLGEDTPDSHSLIMGLEADLRDRLKLSSVLYRSLADQVIDQVKKDLPPRARGRADLKREWHDLLSASEGPLPLVGPDSANAIDEMIADVYAKAPWLDRPIDRVWKLAAACSGPGFRLPPVLLRGPGGTGKSMLTKLIAEAADVPCLEMDASAGSAAFRIAGVEAGWSSARIGEPLRFIAESACPNPIIIVNELDKATAGAVSSKGTETSLINALLPMLDPHSAQSYRCPATGLVLDLSRITWLFTANEIAGFTQPFLSRVETVKIPALTADQYMQALDVLCPDDELLRGHLVQFISNEWERPGFSLRLLARTVQRLRERDHPMQH